MSAMSLVLGVSNYWFVIAYSTVDVGNMHGDKYPLPSIPAKKNQGKAGSNVSKYGHLLGCFVIRCPLGIQCTNLIYLLKFKIPNTQVFIFKSFCILSFTVPNSPLGQTFCLVSCGCPTNGSATVLPRPKQLFTVRIPALSDRNECSNSPIFRIEFLSSLS